MADAMAASSGGVEWSSVLKPFLAHQYETSNRTEIIELCSTIIKCEAQILRHKENNRKFYNNFVVLSADYISSCASKLPVSQIDTVSAACRVLLKYLVNCLQSLASDSNQNSAQIEFYLNAVKVLCIGTSPLSTAEVSILVDTMKGENLPQHVNANPPGAEKDTPNKQESSKTRSDLSMEIFEQLTLPLRDGQTTTRDGSSGGSSSSQGANLTEIAPTNDPISDINKLFLKTNTESLQALRAGDTLVDLCLSLHSIKKARTKVEEALAGKPFSIPTTQSEASAMKNSIYTNISEIKLAMSAINLPVLEPLTPSKLDKLSTLGMAVLHCAVSQAAASAILSACTAISPKCSAQQSQTGPKEDEFDNQAVTLVEEALNMYSYIGTTIKNSTRAGGHVYQNHLLAGAWVLVSGLQSHLTASTASAPEKSPHSREREEKGRSPCKSRECGTATSSSSRTSLQKFQQSFGVLSVAIAAKALTLLTELFEDLYLEACGGAGNIGQIEPAPLTIMGQFTALQRVARVLGAAPLNNFLFYLAVVSYGKACSLKRLDPPEGDTFSQSDSTTYYEDMIIVSDESSIDDDDDSEPILGQWFEETLAPPETADPKSPSSPDHFEGGKSAQPTTTEASVIPEKGEAHGYITLATNIFVFMNKHLLCTRSSYVSRYVQKGLTEQQMLILSAIIRDLDRETSRTESGAISAYFGATLGQLYCEFSGALTKFTHNLVTNQHLTSLQACLLNHLGVSPWNTDVPHGWPLQVYPRTLSVLAQVLLLRPQNEKEASVISIWHRLVNTLIENVLNTPQAGSEAYNEDLNVEHAQVLLYLFHSLNLMQKKSVLLLLAGGVLRCSEVARGSLKDSQLLHLSRLLLLFDYIMKHLYDAPANLLEQVQWNLFFSTNLNSSSKDRENMNRKYTAWQDIEDNYRKISAASEFAMKPRFYVLTTLEINNQDAPKLDGLACNFILGTPDKLRYPLLLDALIEILNVTNLTAGSGASKMTYLGLCSMQYCFTICWRLLQLLPPSVVYMEKLASEERLSAGSLMLHSLIWGPRTSHKNYIRWLKDCMNKQGLYTQHTDKLLKSTSDVVNSLKYDADNAKNCILSLTPELKKGVVQKEHLPPLWHLCLLDCLLSKVQVSLDATETSSTSSSETNSAAESTAYVQDLFPHVLKLTQVILHCTRWSLLHTIVEQTEPTLKTNPQDFENIQDVLAIASGRNSLTNSLSPELISLLPPSVASVLQQWNSSVLEDVTSAPYQNEIIPSESYLLKIIDTHISTISMNSPFTINPSLRRFLQSYVKFICDHASKIENTDTKNRAIEMLVSITLDSRMEYLHDTVSKTLDKLIGDTETDEHQKRVYLQILHHTYKLIINYTSSSVVAAVAAVPSEGAVEAFTLSEQVLHNCLKFYEKILEKSSGRQALESFFTSDKDLVKVLMSVSSPQMSQQYSTRVLHFFNRLFQAAEKSSTDPSLNYLCSSMSKLANVEVEKLQTWLSQIIVGPSAVLVSPSTAAATTATVVKGEEKWTLVGATESNVSSISNDEQKSLIQENSQLLQALTSFIVKQNSNVSEEVALTILKALIPVGTYILSPALEGAGFTDLMVVMTMLADAGSGKGHMHLFPATAEWVELCNRHVAQKEILDNLNSNGDGSKSCVMFDAGCCILDYISDVVNGIQTQQQSGGGGGGSNFRSMSPPWEGETPLDLELDWQEEINHEEEDSGEDSDEDSLSNKLCTFTVTQKEFMNQHWYHCHTCRMLDGVGVCSVCARVCHKGHDISYAKYGNFFCDCGAKEDNTCQALVKRSSAQSDSANPGSNQQQQGENNTNTGGPELTSSLRRRTSSPSGGPYDKVKPREKKHINVKQLQNSKEWIVNYLGTSCIVPTLIDFMNALMASVEVACNQSSPVGCYARAVKALQQLHSAEKKYRFTDQLMLVTVGSQEGAFENVRLSYAGEQGQTIRQLLSAHIIRRVAMCCMTSAVAAAASSASSSHGGRRQHLAVSHEKGKITVLQLSALLKQNESSSTRKLTLSKLGSAPIPFTVLSLSSNPCNEDFLAVCGLKDCHVLTFTSAGVVLDHLVLHPQLETGNFIIKVVWLPGSQTRMALVTADFVKIYDLSRDMLSPQYYFLVPSGKIRDCTFMCDEGTYHILLMSSPGHIYTEVLNEDSSAKHGTFYVTNTLEVFHLDVTDVNGQVAGGGVSIYYSHTLGLLFYSYAQGKNFISPITPKNNCLTVVFPIVLAPVAASGTGGNKGNGPRNAAPQPLCQWMEVTNHPGLVICALQSSNNPVILMLTPETILIQEMKSAPPKTKITDMVALRHYSGGNEPRTTLMLLCEDGSLKMSVANMETTGYWMSPNMQPTIAGSSAAMKPKKKKQVKTGKTSGSVSFPVDFFEHCQLMNDVEFGGNDLLQIYNTAQLKHRLNATGLYVACNKPLGFTVEITNADVNMVMMGLRVLVGSQDVQRAPSFVEVFGRIISLTVTRSRWYDIPFSREESLQADKKLSVMFGPSQDPETLTMVDSIKVYGKTKDTFGWPEETEEAVTTTTTNGNTQSANAVATDTESQTTTVAPVTKLEKLVVGILEALDGSFSLHSLDDKLRQPTLKIATQLLTLPTPPLIQVHSKALLSSLHSSRPLYHNYKDHALLQHVLSSLNVMTESDTKEIDAESFYRLILIVRGIAVARPQNLVKFCDSHTGIQDVVLDDPLDSKATTTATGGSSSVTTSKTSKSQHILLKLMDVLWLLHSLNPDNPSLAPVVVPGLKHTEQVIHALVEIVHAFNSCDTYSNITMAVYLQLLLCKDSMIAFSAKQALSKVLKPKVKKKRVVIPEEEEQCSTPPPAKSAEAHEPKPSTSNGGGGGSSSSTSSGRSAANRDDNQEDNQGRQYDVAAAEAMVLLQQQAGVSNDNQHNVIVSHNALEALLGGAGGFQPLLDIPPDADDETMVELAIALSLQEHDIGGGHHHGLLTNEELAQVAQVGQGAQGQEAGHFSDTTASAAGSDDEGSTAATDGSTLRTSPADQGGGSAAGSESGGSGVESITGEHNVSGRSSAYGDDKDIVVISAPRSGDGAQTASNPSAFPPATVATTLDSSALLTQEQQQEAIDAEIDSENSGRLHVLRLQLLERLTEYLPKLRNVDGVRAIPFLQVVLQLSSELDGHSDRDRACFSALLGAVILELDLNQPNAKDKDICVRSTQKEVQLVLMKLLSVFMGRTRSSSSTSSSSTATSSTAVTVAATASTSTTTAASKSSQTDTSSFVCRTTATVLHKANTISYCNGLLQSLLAYWTSANGDDNKAASSGNLLKEHLTRPPPDMTPFFLKQFVKENGPDFFGTYPELLTEMALRLPYQVHKYSEVSEPTAAAFDGSWFQYLCDYMMTSQTPTVRRQVRKLLLFICGSKEKYRQHRDLHALCAHMKGVKNCCIKGGYEPSLNVQHSLSLTYDNLVDLVEHLKGCVEVAVNRTGNWQRYCLKNDDTIAFLVQISCLLEEGVAPTILNLLQCAIANGGVGAGKASKSSGEGGSAKEKQQQQQQGTSGSSSRKDREKSDDSATDAVFEESNCVQLVEQINRQVSREVFACFVKTFMLETNTTSVRWQAHALIQAIYKNSKAPEQESLLRLLWQLWPLIANYGRKASQFVDLLGYFSLRFFQNNFVLPQVTEYVDRAVNILMTQNELLAHHPNANLYTHMSQFVELDGYYLESEPCLVCNNPEVNFANIKLSSLKVDSKFTTTTQIVKLLNSHTISRITVRIGDLKRSKMVRTINIYYNNRSVQAVVELKNKPALWHKAKKVTVPSGQTEVKIEFPLPIVACNLMVEYADFYENIQASSETLQCPRCSAAVPANPGVCANCGENVFQCHKCRAINYDEKDPFLCHACGFCKYAKFDFSLLAKPCCAVEPIENDEDRKKTVASINSLLERADRSYKQLIANKPALESLVLKVTEHRSEGKGKEEGGGGTTGNAATTTTTANATAPTAAAAAAAAAVGSQVKVNKTIQMLAQQYCNECRNSFEELSKIIQRVLVSRRELVAYDRKHRDVEFPKAAAAAAVQQPTVQGSQADMNLASSFYRSHTRCYGCSTAATEHCLTLLRALASNLTTREILCSKGLIQELVWNNLRKGSTQIQEEVKHLLCILTKDNPQATEELCDLLMARITTNLSSNANSCDLGTSVRHEISLLAALVQKEDECWELKLRCMMGLFLKACEDSRSPLVMASVILPCLKILQGLMKPPENGKKAKQEKPKETLVKELTGVTVDVRKFLNKVTGHSFADWKARVPEKTDTPKELPTDKQELKIYYLSEKYAKIWKGKMKRNFTTTDSLQLDESAWLKAIIFNNSSRLARQVACSLIELMCNSHERKKQVLILLTCFLEELGRAGESAAEFLTLYQGLIQETPWKQYLTIQGVLGILAQLITDEIQELHRLEATTLTSDLAQGYALNQLTELLASFLDDPAIRRQHKSRLVGAVLNGYLSLRRLVIQRTRLIDDTQEKLLELLEEMTTGTEAETKSFMAICIQTAEGCDAQEILTPVFIFERLCSIIYPEENDVDEFFLTLEKDPQQEDFLQGRMLGNPYSSTEAGLGPLMRDVKNKICQDCELVALLDDDNGMELLVNNKIISLDLPVKDVYKKVWVAEGGDHDAMRVVYRMRGLLGDATEEFIETLSNKAQSAVDNEEVYKMANVLADCGGLTVMVKRLGAIQNAWRAKSLLQVLLKLFRLSIKVTRCQEVLIQPELGAMEIFLRTLQLCLDSESDASQAAVTEQLLDIMETVLSKATSESLEKFEKFSRTFGSPEYVKSLLTCSTHPSVRNNQPVMTHLTKVVAALVYGNAAKMSILTDHFRAVLDLNKYDFDHTAADQQKLEMFCVLTGSIERNAIGNTLKDHIIALGIVRDNLEYITMHAPCVKPTLLRTDSDDLKDFISKPALKYCLRFLTGLAHSHENTQLAVAAAETIPIIHRLEQVSSDEHVGSLAENLLEALCTNPTVAKQIEEVREFTRSEKKRLAMAMREKQLGQLGMRTNDKGQVTAKSTILQQIEELGEETGLVCCICREGYKYQSTKVLGIYTFTKRCNADEFEAKARRTTGYTTVSHFNVVHIDCHMNAVRLARARDEWESAALQNANTKCNGLLPLWGPQVPESAFASCLARHNTYLQESTNHRDIGHGSTIHDLKLLLLRFALEKSFHEDTGGGGPQSNMHLIPYIVHIALYVINTTRASKREEGNLTAFLKTSSHEKCVESCYEAEGPLYWSTMSVLLHSPGQWGKHRTTHLRRLVILAHTRHCNPTGPCTVIADKAAKEYAVYKPYLVFFGLIDGIYNHFFKGVTGPEEQWSTNLADHIRHNDEALLKASEKLLSAYTEELLPCTSFSEFCDVTGLLDAITSPDTYISDLLKEFP